MDLNAIRPRSERELYIKNKCLDLLNKYGGDTKEHMKQLAIFIANEMEDDYKPKVFNDPEPEIMREYKALASEKDKMQWEKDYPDWRQRDDVSAWRDKKAWVQRENESSKSFLEECVDALGDQHPLQKQTLHRMLAEYGSEKVPVAEINWQD